MGYAQVESFNMNGNIVQLISGDNAIEVSKEVKNELSLIEKKMSFNLLDSEVSNINIYASIDFVEVPEDVFNIINKSIEYSKLTKGFFDITLAPLISEYKEHLELEKALKEDRIKELKEIIGYNYLMLDHKNKAIALKKRGQKINLGGIIKGYSIDKVIDIYKSNNIKSAMINIDGKIGLLGKKEDGQEWIVEVENPYNQQGECIAVLKLENVCVANYWKCISEYNEINKEYGVIFNISGEISNNALISIFIICKEGIKADALSKAVFLMGLNYGINFLKTLKDVYGVLITKENEVYVSFEIKEKFYMMDKENFRCIYF